MGEAVAGRKIGNKALLLGGIAGTIPDLDVLTSPFFNEIERLHAHRGITHALVFAFVIAPLLGWLFAHFDRKKLANFKDYTLLFFLGIFTHPLLDACTAYGTQLFLPFSNYRVSWSNIFIIDFFYTAPLLIGIIACLFLPRNSPRRRFWNNAGLAISSLYLLLSFGMKIVANRHFEHAFAQQKIPQVRYLTGVTPLNIFLWYGVAETADGYYIGHYSVFDKSDSIPFSYIPRNENLLNGIENEPAVETLKWFAKGFYFVERTADDKLYFYDLKFGKDGFDPQKNTFVFNFELYQDETGMWRFREIFNGDNIDYKTAFAELWTRIKGV